MGFYNVNGPNFGPKERKKNDVLGMPEEIKLCVLPLGFQDYKNFFCSTKTTIS